MKTITILLTASLLIGCAGRDANPVPSIQYGDNERSCESLNEELAMISQQISRLIPETNKTGKNVALGVTGWFFIVPLFFMDLSNAEKVEIQALRDRAMVVNGLKSRKGCDKQDLTDA